jgi:dephospho-CoA kinase
MRTAAPRPWVLGLTGGIASGKSTVADRFAALGADVIDTDQLARAVVAPGTPGLDELVSVFGREVLDPTGALDRRAMRARIFADPSARARLEALLHPLIEAEARRRIAASRAPYVVLVVPLLAEVGRYDFIDRVLVVDLPSELQRQRLVQRDDITVALAEAMLAAQAPRPARLAIADDVIDNSADRAALLAAVDALHPRYLELAAAGRHASVLG